MRCSDLQFQMMALVTGRGVTGPDKGKEKGGSSRGLVLNGPRWQCSGQRGPMPPTLPEVSTSRDTNAKSRSPGGHC